MLPAAAPNDSSSGKGDTSLQEALMVDSMSRPESFWGERPAPVEEDTRPVLSFCLEQKRERLPSPGACGYCGGERQFELLPFEVSTPRFVVSATPTWGWGCTDCGLKTFAPATSIALLRGAAKELRNRSDSASAEYLERDAQALEEAAAVRT
jgi:hypothetical protein